MKGSEGKWFGDADQLKSQQILVDTLQAQVAAEQKISDIKGQQKANAAATTDNTIGAEQDKEFRRQSRGRLQASRRTDAKGVGRIL